MVKEGHDNGSPVVPLSHQPEAATPKSIGTSLYWSNLSAGTDTTVSRAGVSL